MRKLLSKIPYVLIGILLAMAGTAYAVVFNSGQLAPGASNGNCLGTDGSNNLWTSCGTGGGGGSSGGWSTSTPNIISTNWLSSTNALVGINSSTPKGILTVKGITGTTTPVLLVTSSTNATLLKVDGNGSTTIPSLIAGLVRTTAGGALYTDASVYLTANQNITLSGDVTGSGTTAITTAYNNIVPVNKGGTNTSTAATQLNQILGWNNASYGAVTFINGANITITTSTPGSLTIAATGLQASGNYITALTGDIVASGPGSAAATYNGIVPVNKGGTATSVAPTQLGQLLAVDGSNAKYAPATLINGANILITTSTPGSLTIAATGLQPAGTYVTAVTGSGSITSSGGTTPAIALVNLTSNDILFGQGNGTIATSSSLTWDGTKFTTTNASTTNVSVSGNLYTSLASGNCLQTGAGGLVTSTGVACGSGTGSSQWTVGNGLIYNATSTDLVGIGTSNPLTTLYVQGKSGTNPFVVASSTGSTALLTVGQNGSTTISQIGTGIVQSASGGVLYTVPASTYLTSVSLTAGATISGSAFTFGTTTDTNILTQIVCATATCTFTPQWTGVLAPARGGTGTSTAPTQQGQLLAADSSNAKYGPTTLVNSATLTFATGTVAQISANVLKVPNALTFNNGGAGASSGQTFDGSGAATISYNTIGAQVAGTYLGNTNVSGTNGQLAYFVSANTVNSGSKLLFDGTAFGFNATSSTISFNIQGTANSANTILNVASSSGISILAVTSDQKVGIGSTSPTATLAVEGTSTNPTLNIFTVASSTNTALLTVAANGSTTLSSLTSGVVQSNAGSLFIQNVALASQVSGVLPAGNGGTGTSTAPTQQGQLLGADSTGTKYAPTTLINGANITITTSTVGQITVAVTGVQTSAPTIVAGGTATGPAFTFATSTDTNLLTQIVCASSTCTFTPQWTGVLAPSRGGTGTSTAPTQQGQLLIADSTGAKYAPGTLVNSSTLTFSTSTASQLSANVLKVPNALTFNNGGAGASSGQTFDGSAAATISYNTIGAQVAGTYLGNTNVSGTNGQVAYFTGANTVNSATKLLFDGTNFGFNATSSTVGVNIQGTQGTNNPFNVASSSGISVLAVTNLQRVTIGSSTPQATLVVEGSTTIPTLDIFRVASSTNTTLFNVAANGNIGIGTTTALGLTSIQGSSAIDLLDFYNTAGTKIGSFASSTDPMVSIGSTTPLALFTIVASSTSATTTGQFGDPSASKGFCLAWARDDGSMVYIHIPAGSTTFTIATATTTCATIFR